MIASVADLLSEQLRLRPDVPSLTDDTGIALTWAGFDHAVFELDEIFRRAGVASGDRVVILCENSVAAIVALFACWRRGAVAVPVNARLSEGEVARVVAFVGPRAVFCTSEVSSEASAHATRLGAEAVQGTFGAAHLAELGAASPDQTGDCAVMLFTTGTTGLPKGVMLSHSNLRFGGQASAKLREMTANDVIYGVLPVSHVFGLASIVVAAVSTGAQIKFAARFSEKSLFEALSRDITLFSGVPQMHAHLMHYAAQLGLPDLRNAPLRYVSSGAAPLDPEWKRQAEAFYGLPLQNGYGMTETTAGVTITKNVLGSDDVSAGPPLPGVEVKIEAPSAEDGVGEVMTRGPHVMMGYYRNPSETSKVLDRDGWMHTGDLGYLDQTGNLHIVGRAKELIIRGGFNVFPPEVEAAINAHPDVVQSAVLGRAVQGDEEIVAFVQKGTDSALDAPTLDVFLRKRLAGYKRPGRIIIAHSLPAAPTGKVLRHKLMSHFAAELEG